MAKTKRSAAAAKTPFDRLRTAYNKACTLSNNGKHAAARQLIAPIVDELETIAIPNEQLRHVAAAWAMMGSCEEGLGRLPVAMAWYARAMQAGYDSVFLLVCDAYLARQDFEAILRCTEPLIAQKSKKTEIDLWCWLRIYTGYAAIATGNESLARRSYDELREGWPNHLSRARADLEQLAASHELARSILTTFPTQPPKPKRRA